MCPDMETCYRSNIYFNIHDISTCSSPEYSFLKLVAGRKSAINHHYQVRNLDLACLCVCLSNFCFTKFQSNIL